jgi:hypothetical protein
MLTARCDARRRCERDFRIDIEWRHYPSRFDGWQDNFGWAGIVASVAADVLRFRLARTPCIITQADISRLQRC